MPSPDLSRAVWRKSRRSNGSGDCVEVAVLDPTTVAVRDSKDDAGPVLLFGHEAWTAFLTGVRAGDIELP